MKKQIKEYFLLIIFIQNNRKQMKSVDIVVNK